MRILQKLTKWKHSRTMVNLILVSSFCAVLAVSFSCPVLGFQMEWKVVFCDDRELPIRLSLGVYLQFSHCDLADVCFADKKKYLSDACCVQICSNFKARVKSQT